MTDGSIPVTRADPRAEHIPWTMTVAVLTTFLALYLREGRSVLLPLLAIGLVAHHFVFSRLPREPALIWGLRIFLGVSIFAISFARPAPDIDTLIDTRFVNGLGELCGAEIVLRCWRRPLGTTAHAAILLSGITYFAACNTFSDRLTPILTPLYLLFLALSVLSLRPSVSRGMVTRNARLAAGAALLAALLFGGVMHFGFRFFRYGLTTWGMSLLHERISIDATGLSTMPHLGRTFGEPGSLTRAMLIRGESPGDFSHLRGITFDVYARGSWEPTSRNRTYLPVDAAYFRSRSGGSLLHVTRLLDNEGLIFAPLNASGLDLGADGDLQWTVDGSGPLLTNMPATTTYSLALGGEETQGPLCIPPNPLYLHRLRVVSPDIEPPVRQLARDIVGALATPRAKADAVQQFFARNFTYSLVTDPGKGDPISNFLLKRKPAHCEYFASGAVILLRCVGVPARYVVGFYAHESDGAGRTVVRLRDAHAWAEYWDGGAWRTLDTTPAGGRPDQLAGPVPLLTRWKEWLQDRFNALRDFLTGPSGLKFVAAVAGIVLVILAARAFPGFRRQKQARQAAFVYTSGQAEVMALLARFESLARRKGLACPIGVTWREYLDSLPDRPGFDMAAARAFVAAYDAARFGTQEEGREIANLRALLARAAD